MTSLSFLSSLQVEDEEDLSSGEDEQLIRLNTEALHYVQHFDSTKQELAVVLFSLYNSQVFDNLMPPFLNVTWSKRLSSTAGYFSGRRELIVLSAKIIRTPSMLVSTVIHEMCHAAVRFIDGKTGLPPHGAEWRKWTVKARNIFPEIPKITVTHSFLSEEF